jgi:hypothetical protein
LELMGASERVGGQVEEGSNCWDGGVCESRTTNQGSG